MRTLLSTVVAMTLVGLLSGCGGSPTPTPAPSTSSPAPVGTSAPATPEPTASGSAGPSLSQQASAALPARNAYSGRGYAAGTDLPTPTGPTAQICGKSLAVDQGGSHAAAGRSWSSTAYAVTATVHVYAGPAKDAITQIRAAAESCATYSLTVNGVTHTYTIVTKVADAAHYGIESAYRVCEQVKPADTNPTAICTDFYAAGRLLGVLRVAATTDSVANAGGELNQLSEALTLSLQA
jgi:hypothetical protein